MATKDQFEFFRSLYHDEERRYDQLSSRATLYLGIITLLLGTVALKLDKTNVLLARTAAWLVLLDALLFAAAMIAVVWGSVIRGYEGVADPKKLIDSLRENPPSDSDFFDAR